MYCRLRVFITKMGGGLLAERKRGGGVPPYDKGTQRYPYLRGKSGV